jgi:hypothetical protein
MKATAYRAFPKKGATRAIPLIFFSFFLLFFAPFAFAT